MIERYSNSYGLTPIGDRQDDAYARDEASEPLLEEPVASSRSDEEDVSHDPSVLGRNNHLSEKLASSKWRPIDSHSFIPSLEGIRGVAVILAHCTHILAEPELMRDIIGPAGVTIFFVLSGFLITGVLMRLQTKSKGSSVYRHLPRFYADRAVRLTPALYLMVAIMTPIYLHHNYPRSSVIRYMFMALFYLTNIEYLWINGDQGIFSNTWSLACEEHFYILWSFTLPLICRLSLRNRIAALAALMGISQLIRIYTSMYPGSFFGINYYFNSINNFWKMLMGASLRLIPIPPIFMRYQWAYFGSIGIFAMLGLVAYLPSEKLHLDKVAPGWQDHKAAARTWSDPIAAICTVLIICGVQDARGGPQFLESQFFRFIGRISYAWYLWQLPIMLNLGGLKSGNGIAYGSTAIAFMVAIVSTIYVEEPIRAVYVAWKARRSGRDTLQYSHIP